MKRLRGLIPLTIVSFWMVAMAGGGPRDLFAQEGAASVSQPSLQGGAQEPDQAYMIGPQNLLLIKIMGESIDQTFRVDDFGYITHPLVGRIKIAGQSVVQAEEMMTRILKEGYILDPHVSIFVLEHSRFSILGEVRKPGNYEILGQMTIVEAISMAGGFTPVANQRKVTLLRKENNEEKKIVVNVDDLISGKSQDDVQLQAGDVINVSKSFF